MTFKSKLLQTSLLSGFAAIAVAGSAFAQGQTPPAPPPPAADDSSVEELVVTGSRIRKNEFTSASPIEVITSDQAVLQGLVDTATLLQQSPIASGSAQQNQLLGAYVTTGGPGIATISLRGLGENRTLVLMDGRRVGPAGVRGSVGPVDLNVIPGSILERTEILKDGASSIYGSDAVAGVVNFITKTDLDGGKISVFADVPFKSGGEIYNVSGAWGKVFDRGYFNVSGEYSEQKELKNGDRKYTSCAQDRVYDPDTFEQLDYIDPSTGKTKCWNVFAHGAIVTAVYGGSFQYAVPGQTYPGAGQGNNIGTVFPGLAAMGFVRAGRGNVVATQPYTNYDDPAYARASAISPYKRYTIYAAGGYDIAPGVEAYANLLYNRRESRQNGYLQLAPLVWAGNPNNPFIDGNGDWFDALPLIPYQLDQWQNVDYVRGVAGLRGKVGDVSLIGGWDWDIYAEYSHSNADYYTDFIHLDRLTASSETDLPSGCDPSLLQPSVSGQTTCLSIPFFSRRLLEQGAFTPEELAYLFDVAHGKTKYTQAMVEGSITGDILQLGSGPVSGAFGFSLRHESIDDQPDPEESAGNLDRLTSATRTKGHDNIKELFGEIDIPLLRDWGPVGNFNVTGSARYTDYDSYGDNITWKVGLDWQPASWLRFRATKGTSFRAPALYELFIGDQTGFRSQNDVDPCIRYENSSSNAIRTNCAADGIPLNYGGGGNSVTIITGGGAGRLKAETSDAETIGVILTPHFENFDLSLAVDYTDIRVHDEVGRLGAGNILRQCYLSADFPTDPLCDLFTRDTGNTFPAIDTVNDSYINISEQSSRAIDVNVRYRQEFSFGTITFDGQATWQLEDVTQLLGESTPTDFNGSTAEPDFTAELQLRYDWKDWTVFWDVDIFSKTSDSDLDVLDNTDVHFSSRYAQEVYYKQFTEFQAYHTIAVQKKLDTWTFRAGIQNVFDDPPPALSGNESFRVGYSALNMYDLYGRRGFIQIDKSF